MTELKNIELELARFRGRLAVVGMCLLLVTYVPAFSLWLPGLLK